MSEGERFDSPPPSDQNVSAKPSITRRSFLHLAGAGILGLFFPWQHSTFSAPQTEKANREREVFDGNIRCIAIRGLSTREAVIGKDYRIQRRDYTIQTIERALQNNQANIVVTSEYSFVHDEHPLTLMKVNGSYDISPDTDYFHQETITQLKRLAKTHKCSIFAATFNEAVNNPTDIPGNPSVGIEYNTMLHINPEGKIIGVKRKMYPPSGSFEVTVNNKTYKALPIICGEISAGTYQGDENSKTSLGAQNNPSEVVDWIRKAAPFDLLIHPMEQADVDWGVLSANAASNTSENLEDFALQVDWAKKAFESYYAPYWPYLKSRSLVVTADLGISSVLDIDLQHLPIYKDDKGYTFASN